MYHKFWELCRTIQKMRQNDQTEITGNATIIGNVIWLFASDKIAMNIRFIQFDDYAMKFVINIITSNGIHWADTWQTYIEFREPKKRKIEEKNENKWIKSSTIAWWNRNQNPNQNSNQSHRSYVNFKSNNMWCNHYNVN